MVTKIKILLIEDVPSDAQLIEIYLKEVFSETHTLTIASNLSQGKGSISKEKFDVIISDMNLPDSHGINTLINILSLDIKIPVIILTDHDSESFGLNAVKLGAADFLNKHQLNSLILQRSIIYSIERNKLLQMHLIKARDEIEKKTFN
jgi:two-component system cell cycle response regulator